MRKLFIIIISLVFFAACNKKEADMKSTATTERHRPQFHFTPPAKWMNDPNGMVYYDGEYHLFYQHYPDSTVWGPMHWGHAVSKDMIGWEHLPIALYPDSLGYIFSGSAVADVNNTAGFKNGNEIPLVAIYTYHDMAGEKAGKLDHQTQGIAFSNDKGRTWTKYEGNPVVKNPGVKDFRDPKVMWHEASQHWIMTLAVGDHIAFYHSPDLKNWTQTGTFGKTFGAHGGVWECPDLFELPIENSDSSKWILLVSINPGGPNGGSATQYFIGDFDGKTFVSENPASTALWIDYGTDNYAGVTWSNISKQDGRRLFLGWMSNWLYATTVPTEAWRSAMTVPRSLHLQQTPRGLRLLSKPVKELEILRDKKLDLAAQKIDNRSEIKDFQATTGEFLLEFDLNQTNASDFGIEISNSKGEKVQIGYAVASQQFYIDRSQAGKQDFSDQFAKKHFAPRVSDDKIVRVHVFLDVASVELFADNGSTVMTDIFFPNEDFNKIAIFSKAGSVVMNGGEVWTLKGK